MNAVKIEERIAVWMQNVLDQNGWSAEEWARKADTSATNITRFLNNKKHVPSSKTIDALAGVCHLPPPIGGTSGFQISGRIVPIVKNGEEAGNVVSLHGKPEQEQLVTLLPIGQYAFAIKVGTGRLQGAGIITGDYVIVEPTSVRKPVEDSVVCFIKEDKVEVAKWHFPYLVSQSSDAYLPIEHDEVDMLGVVIQQIRNLV